MERVPVTKIQRFCTQDGYGVRTTVFFKGCPLKCLWCHNPETQSPKAEFLFDAKFCVLCGACAAACPAGVHRVSDVHAVEREKCLRCMRCADVCPSGAIERAAREMSVAEILSEVLKDRAFYGKTGGMTLSGGEPMFHPEFALKLLAAAKEAGISTALETCGFFDASAISDLVSSVDLFLWDFKDGNDERHKKNTGVSHRKMIENLLQTDALGGKSRLRCILIAGVNDDESNFCKIAETYHCLRHCEGVEILPYHTFGGGKNVLLGRADNAKKEWIPTAAGIRNAKKQLRKKGVKVL